MVHHCDVIWKRHEKIVIDQQNFCSVGRPATTTKQAEQHLVTHYHSEHVSSVAIGEGVDYPRPYPYITHPQLIHIQISG